MIRYVDLDALSGEKTTTTRLYIGDYTEDCLYRPDPIRWIFQPNLSPKQKALLDDYHLQTLREVERIIILPGDPKAEDPLERVPCMDVVVKAGPGAIHRDAENPTVAFNIITARELLELLKPNKVQIYLSGPNLDKPVYKMELVNYGEGILFAEIYTADRIAQTIIPNSIPSE